MDNTDQLEPFAFQTEVIRDELRTYARQLRGNDVKERKRSHNVLSTREDISGVVPRYLFVKGPAL